MEPIIIGRSGTQKKRIEDRSVSREHCKVTYQGDGKYIIENLSSYGTRVDGKDIVQTTAGLNSRLQLGPTYTATLAELIGDAMGDARPHAAASNAHHSAQSSPRTAQPQVKTFNVSHLRDIWENYNRENIEMADAQRKIGLVRGAGMLLAMGGGLIAAIVEAPVIGLIFSGLGILSLGYSFIGMKKGETPLEKQMRYERFEESWVCPNHECGRTLPIVSFKRLMKDNHSSCPYCKCKYVEK